MVINFLKAHLDDAERVVPANPKQFTGLIRTKGPVSLDFNFSVDPAASPAEIGSAAFSAVMDALLEAGAEVGFDEPEPPKGTDKG